jgi:phosphoglycerate dehydrogenase-like enzyme
MTAAPRVAGAPRVAVLPPDVRTWAADAVRAGGGVVVEVGEAEALVWTATGWDAGYQPSDLAEILEANSAIRWVQLPWAGVEPFAAAGVIDSKHQWTCGKGVYAQPVAEHALALALAGLHHLKAYSQARSWTDQAGSGLAGGRVCLFGGGGIAEALIGLLAPFGCHISVVRRRPGPLAGAGRVIGWDDFAGAEEPEVLARADLVVLALALTPDTTGFFGRPQFEAMASSAWLVNVARGRHIVTSDLVDALAASSIGGAALDVTDPEPLPEGHPLWTLPNCLITPHTANTYEMAIPLLSARIADNVGRFARDEPLLGGVFPELGY